MLRWPFSKVDAYGGQLIDSQIELDNQNSQIVKSITDQET